MIRGSIRFIGILLVATLALGGCAGGQSGNGASEAKTEASGEASQASSAGSASSKTEEKTDAATADTEEEMPAVNTIAEDLAFVRFSNTTRTEREIAENNERASVTFTYDVLEIDGRASDGETELTALSRKVTELEYNRGRERESMFETYTKNAESRNRQEKYECILEQRLSVLRADTRVFSYLEETVTGIDTAGASEEEEGETYSCFSRTLDAKNGEEIRLTDVVKDTERLSVLAAEAILEKYDTSNPAYNASVQFEGVRLQERILALLESEENEETGSFAFAPAYYGLRLIFSRKALCDEENLSAYLEEVSEINTRDSNRFDITIPYTADSALFETSCTELPVSFFARLESGVTYEADFGDGPVSLQIATPRKYENNTVLYTGECTVRIGENNRQSFNLVGAEEYANYGVYIYLVKTEDAHYLYLDVTGKDETDRLHVYAIEDGNVRFVGVSEEMLDNDRLPPFDPAFFMTEAISFILPDPFLAEAYTGTRGLRESFVSPGGMPGSGERFYLAAGEDVRVTAIELNLDTLQDPDDDRPEKESYPAGTSLTMWRIEKASHADLIADDGRLVRLYINGVDTIDLIDGHELHEAFADPRF